MILCFLNQIDKVLTFDGRAEPHYGWADVVGDSSQLLSIEPRERPPGVYPNIDFGSSPPPPDNVPPSRWAGLLYILFVQFVKSLRSNFVAYELLFGTFCDEPLFLNSVRSPYFSSPKSLLMHLRPEGCYSSIGLSIGSRVSMGFLFSFLTLTLMPPSEIILNYVANENCQKNK